MPGARIRSAKIADLNKTRLFTLVAIFISALSACLSAAEPRTSEAQADAGSTRRNALASVKSWGIELRSLDPKAIAASSADLVVIDHPPQRGNVFDTPSYDTVASLQRKPDGSRRIVLAYLSVGEAERYRFYWNPAWDTAERRPSWLGAENRRWPGNYHINFTDPDWQSLIFGDPQSYLDRIMSAGFDGVYLDRADAFQDSGRNEAESADAMIGFLCRLADHARRRNPGFLVVMQNAEELAASPALLSRLDGLAKEDLLFGADNTDKANAPQMVRDSLALLRSAKKAGVRIFLLEYTTNKKRIEIVKALARREGFLLDITDRLLATFQAGRAPAADGGAPTKLPRPSTGAEGAKRLPVPHAN